MAGVSSPVSGNVTRHGKGTKQQQLQEETHEMKKKNMPISGGALIERST